MNTKEMIEVMQAYANGEKIEEMDRFAVSGWRPFQGTWNWAYLTFRIAPEPEPKKEGRWERVEIRKKDSWYRTERDIEGVNVVDAIPRVPGFGGIDYQSPFDPKIIVRSMVPIVFNERPGCFAVSAFDESYRPGIPVAAWFWREE